MSQAVITKAPCKLCPFRKDVPIYLRRGRRIEIATNLLEGGSFPCHATVEYETDEEPDTSESSFCAGAAKSLLLIDAPNQIMRIMARLGAMDLDEVEARGVEVWDLHSWQTVPEGSTGEALEDDDEDDIEPCSIANPGCEAPAGTMIDGGVAYGTESAEYICPTCGEPVCDNCSNDDGICDDCNERET